MGRKNSYLIDFIVSRIRYLIYCYIYFYFYKTYIGKDSVDDHKSKKKK